MNANRNGGRKQGYAQNAPKRQISQVHIARAVNGLGCKNCIYANFCAAQPTLRAYVNGIMKKDCSELLYNENYRAI